MPFRQGGREPAHVDKMAIHLPGLCSSNTPGWLRIQFHENESMGLANRYANIAVVVSAAGSAGIRKNMIHWLPFAEKNGLAPQVVNNAPTV